VHFERKHVSLPSAVTPIRVAVFDIGDVLFIGHPQTAFFARWARHIGIAPGRLRELLWYGPDIEEANVGAITAEEYCRRCAARLGSDEARVRAIIEDAFSGERLNEELATYIWALRPRIQVVALTNNWSFGRTLIERRGITGLFDLIVSSAEEGVKKPHSRIYEIMLERLGIIPEEAVFVDDSAENIEAARALGIHSIQFCSTEQTILELDVLLSRHSD
jgi:putative hydrolase of the HAD superfamily